MGNARKISFLLLFFILSSAVPGHWSRQTRTVLSLVDIKPAEVIESCVAIEKVPIDIILNSLPEFLDALGERESSNRYFIVNQYGYMGKYQFGMSTLQSIGMYVSREEFLNNPNLQEEAMLKNLARNKRILSKYITYYDGRIVNGVFITEAGILAGAHLAGPGGVKRFFNKGFDFSDGNGTKLTTYMSEFKNFTFFIGS